MREAIFVTTQRDNIIAFAQLYSCNKDDSEIFTRLLSTFRIYIEMASEYLCLENSLWTLEKEAYFLVAVNKENIDNDKLNELLKNLLVQSYPSHKPKKQQLH